MKHIFFLCTLISGSVLLTEFDKIDFFSRYPDSPANYDKELDNETVELPKDADGWTVITPSADSKIIYVPPLVVQSLYLDEYKNASEIVIYPIPVSQELFISGEMPMLSVEIFDLTGRKLLEKEAENKTRIQINISKIPEGIWLIRVNQENKSHVKKIIIEH